MVFAKNQRLTLSSSLARNSSVLLVTALLALAGCAPRQLAPVPAVPAIPAAPAIADHDSAAFYDKLRAAGQTVLTVDSAHSLIAITVRKSGALARLGHDHVIASRTLAGAVAPQQGRADLHFRLDALTVDETALRAEAGLDTQPSADAIAGTRHNMLTKALDAERYPDVTIRIARRAGAADNGTATPMDAAITLHGVTRRYAVPVTVVAADGALTASGAFEIRQSDFGIEPFSVMGGALGVHDTLALRFTIRAAQQTI